MFLLHAQGKGDSCHNASQSSESTVAHNLISSAPGYTWVLAILRTRPSLFPNWLSQRTPKFPYANRLLRTLETFMELLKQIIERNPSVPTTLFLSP